MSKSTRRSRRIVKLPKKRPVVTSGQQKVFDLKLQIIKDQELLKERERFTRFPFVDSIANW